MRQWLVPVSYLCDKHLNLQHATQHRIVDFMLEGRSLDGHFCKRLVDPSTVRYRHSVLASEMENRGWRHKSSLKDIPSKVLQGYEYRMLDINKNIRPQLREHLVELFSHCNLCYGRIYKCPCGSAILERV